MDISWSDSMQPTYEFYEVDPGTWKNKRRIDVVTGVNISRDLEADTMGSATIDVTGILDECYIRSYMTPRQNGVKYSIPLGTHIVQTPSEKFDGKVRTVSLDGYTPMIELKENQPPIGYFVPKGANIIESAYEICKDHMRAPLIKPPQVDKKLIDDFIANTDDTWMSFLSDLLAKANYTFDLNEMGEVLFAPYRATASLQPIWTYDDSNSSILYADITVERDLYDIPNVVEVIYSPSNGVPIYSRVVNDDVKSPTSTVNRGREITHRETSPTISGNPNQAMVDEYTEQLLKEMSTLEYKISYSHGFTPVRIGDCVRLNYKRAGLRDIKAKVITQSFKCEPGCKVTETAIYTNKLWG